MIGPQRAAFGGSKPLAVLTNSLAADVAMNNTANFFVGPTIAQGTVGTWFASGTVNIRDTLGAGVFSVKLWDGTTVIDSAKVNSTAANQEICTSLSGYITSPAGNIRISVKDASSTSGEILFNSEGDSKDSTLSVMRIG